MSGEVAVLTEAERSALAAAFARSTRNPEHLAFLAAPAVERILATRVREAEQRGAEKALRDAAEWIEGTRSLKGIAPAALDPGKAFAVAVLTDRAHRPR